MFIISLSVFRYPMTYLTLVGSVLAMNLLAYLQSNLIEVTRPLSGYILPTIIGGVIGMLLSSNRVSCREKREEQKRLFIDIVQSLSIALDERDAYTYGHSSRVTDFSMALGKRAGLSKLELEMLELGSILHDIGKIGIPDTILNKPEALNSEEIEMIRQHPIKGERIIGLSNNNKIQMIVDCIRSHHERYDGSGYPDGLSGTGIPVLARIVAIADAFDTMTSRRVYRLKLKPQDAVAELLSCSGSQFDPQLTRQFSEMLRGDEFGMLLTKEGPDCEPLFVPHA
jgi:HD-GYP domain-containing protein (c-di-GMP phosphodiesterase class II)